MQLRVTERQPFEYQKTHMFDAFLLLFSFSFNLNFNLLLWTCYSYFLITEVHWGETTFLEREKCHLDSRLLPKFVGKAEKWTFGSSPWKGRRSRWCQSKLWWNYERLEQDQNRLQLESYWNQRCQGQCILQIQSGEKRCHKYNCLKNFPLSLSDQYVRKLAGFTPEGNHKQFKYGLSQAEKGNFNFVECDFQALFGKTQKNNKTEYQ